MRDNHAAGAPCSNQKQLILTGQTRLASPTTQPPVSNHGLGRSNVWKILTTTGSPRLAPMDSRTSCLSGAFGGRMLSGSAPDLARAKRKISPAILTASSARRKPMRLSFLKAQYKK